MAGAVPGLLLAVGMMATSYYISVKKKHPKRIRSSAKEVGKGFIDAFWALMMTLLILFGIIGGIFTPTEASIVAVLYAFFVGLFFYKSLKLKDIKKVIVESAGTTASLMVLVGFANLFGWILVSEQVPQQLADSMLGFTTNKFVLLLLINILLLFVGSFMETIASLLILYPILLKIALEVGVDPIQFSVIAVLNLIIGLNTPPVGVCLFVASGIGKVSIEKIARAGFPFLLISFLVLALVTYIPEISLFLPGLFID